MKEKSGKHYKESFMSSKRLVLIMSIICLCITIYMIYSGKSKYVLRDRDTRVQRTTGEFHFYSSVLIESGKNYDIYDWNSDEEYVLKIDLMNYIDSLRSTEYDIVYKTKVVLQNNSPVEATITGLDEYEGDIDLDEGEKAGILEINEKNELFNVVISKKQNEVINENDEVTIKVIVESESPYIKTLEATFVLHAMVEESDIPYEMQYVENITNMSGSLSIETNKIKEPVVFSYDNSLLVLNTANPIFDNANIEVNGTTTTVSVELESNKLYIFNFIKLNEQAANVIPVS